jgi:RHS repeat-associated protein
MNEVIEIDSTVSGGSRILWQNGITTNVFPTAGTGALFNINNNTQMTGWSWKCYGSSCDQHAMTWDKGTLSSLDVSTNFESYGKAINDLKQAAGYAIILSSGTFAALWQNGTQTLAPTPPGAIGSNGGAINNKGQIVGIIIINANSFHAMLWQNGTTTDLTPGLSGNSSASKINNYGQIVGSFYPASSPSTLHAAIWQNGVLTDLNSVSGVSGSGWILNSATDINDKGIIVGSGTLNGVAKNFLFAAPEFQNPVPDPTTPYDQTLVASCGGQSITGMCVANAHVSAVSLNLNDTPVGYSPQIGPSALVRLSYDHRTTSQPTSFNYFNVGPKWTLNVLSYIQDDPSNPGLFVSRYVAGGGSIPYGLDANSYNSTSGVFTPENKTGAILTRTPATGAVTSYTLVFPDGSKQVFSKLDSATAKPRRIFLTQMVDTAGNTLSLNYDATLRLTSIIDAASRSTTFSYTNTNTLLVTKITDPFGRFTTLGYDTSGRLNSITDVIGITSSFTYDTVDTGFIKTLTTPYGTSNFSYGENIAANSRFLELTDPLGNTRRLESKPKAPGISATVSGVPVSMSIANGTFSENNTFYWDEHAYPLSITKDINGNITAQDFTKAQITHWLIDNAGQPSGTPSAIKFPNENYVFFNYQGQSQPYLEGSFNAPTMVGRILDDGSTQLGRRTYNALGRITSTIDPLGRKTVFNYDTNNIDLLTQQQQTTVGGTLTTFSTYSSYNTKHEPQTYTDAASKVWQSTYNAAGQVLTVQNPLTQTVTYNYDTKGRLTTAKNAANITALTNTYTANCDTTNPNHLNCDLPASVTDSEGRVVSYLYDALDRVTKITYPDGTHDDYDYKFQSGPLVGTQSLDLRKITDRLGRTTVYAYDANRRLTSVTEPLTASTTRTTQYEYYENGAPKKLTDANSNVTSWDIDLQSRPTVRHYADGSTETTVYENTTSRKYQFTDTLGQIMQYDYDADDSLDDIYYIWGPVSTGNVAFIHDPFWPRLSAIWSEDMGYINYTYTALGTNGALKLASEDGPFANDVIGYGYDTVGRMNSRTMTGGNETFGYDTIGRLNSHGTGIGTFNYTYLGQTSQIASRSVTNGTTTVSTNWGYDTNTNDRRLKTITNSGVSRSYTITSNPYQITAILDAAVATHPYTSRTWSYGYDLADRLLSATNTASESFTYGYDKADNMTSVLTSTGGNGTFTYNNLNQKNVLSYTAAGNVSDDYWQHQHIWDAANRVAETDYKTAPGSTTYTLQKSQFTYDAFNRRAIDTETDVGGNVTSLHILWCGDQVCQVRDGADTVVKRYYPEGEHNLVSGQKLVYMPDHLGSVRDTLNATTGALAFAADYEPYGYNLRSGTLGAATPPDFRFAAMQLHPQSQRYLTKNRMYDPGAPTWDSRDPIREAGGMNLYSYVSGNPVMNTDIKGTDGGPFGMGSIVPCINGRCMGDPDFLTSKPLPSDNGTSLLTKYQEDSILTNPVMRFVGDNPQIGGYLVESGLALATVGDACLVGNSLLFARGKGILNGFPLFGDWFRIGWNWSGTWDKGSLVFRVGIGSKRLPYHFHWNLWPIRWPWS